MYLTFKSEGHEKKTFTKNLINSEYVNKSDIPQQILTLYSVIGRDGTERPNAYKGNYNSSNRELIISPMAGILRQIWFGVLDQRRSMEMFQNNMPTEVMLRYGSENYL